MNWTPAIILPNLYADEALDGEVVALAPRIDPRVQAYCGLHSQFRELISRFTDGFGGELNPLILMVRDDVAAKLSRVEPLASFRDLAALAVIPYSRSLAERNGLRRIYYSDSFHLHPWMTTKDNLHIVCSTPALWAVHDACQFHGQSSPELPPLELKMDEVDRPLFDALLLRWTRFYVQEENSWENRALFRSLNMGNQAAQIPGGVAATIFDFGRSAALWISAFEILTHPSNGNAGLKTVYQLLDGIEYLDAALGERKYPAYGKSHKYPAYGKSQPLRSLPSWFYGELYRIRCDFLHGNPIGDAPLTPEGSNVDLSWLAAPLFRLALTGFLGLSLKGTGVEDDDLGAAVAARLQFERYQRAAERTLVRAYAKAKRD